MNPLLVADIGGTNARFALALGQTAGSIELVHQRKYPCAQFTSFNDVLASYLASLPEKNVRQAAIAVAGPVTGDRVKMTNLDWEFSLRQTEDRFGFDAALFVNDLAAHGLATVNLGGAHFDRIKAGEALAQASRAIIGLGTGLGVASLHWQNSSWRALPTECGHISFAPGNAIEREIQQRLLGEYGYVSLEMLLSGPGLLNIYRALGAIHGRPTEFENAKDILSHHERDRLCAQSVAAFVGVLGSAAGDIALAYGAKGGLYLGGGMAPHFMPVLREPDIIERFLQTGFRREYLTSIPIDVILHPETSLLGAALWYYQQHNVQESAP